MGGGFKTLEFYGAGSGYVLRQADLQILQGEGKSTLFISQGLHHNRFGSGFRLSSPGVSASQQTRFVSLLDGLKGKATGWAAAVALLSRDERVVPTCL